MQVECLKNCDADLGREVKALFVGQVYELPDDIAQPLIDSGAVRAIAVKAVEPAQDKAVSGPEQTKARRGRRGQA
jgi:hypothetical protein